MSPEDVLRVAESLVTLATEREAQGHDCEAELRSAVSRAYYAAFRAAVQLIASLSLHVDREATGHDAAQKDLNNAGDLPLRTVSVYLTRMRAKRNDADYDKRPSSRGHSTDWREEAEDCLDKARELIKIINEIKADPARSTAVRDAIKTYRKKIARPI